MSVQVTLNGDGLNYESEATLIQAAKIIGFLNTDELINDQGAQSQRTNAGNLLLDDEPQKQLSSPREAILDSGAKTNAQKIVILGQYIADRDGSDEFSPSELKTLFVKAGEPAPRNLARDMRDAVRAGYVTESLDTTGAYVVTNTGRKAIADGFKGASKSSRPKSSNGKSSAKARKTPEWLTTVEVSDQLEGYPGYRLMKTRSDKVLWILQWASEHDRKQLSGLEVELVAEQLADSVPNKQVASAVMPHLSKSRVSKNAEGYRILHDGTQYLTQLGE